MELIPGRPWFAHGLAGTLVLIFFLQILSESAIKSAASDEPPHLASGLSYIETGVFRGNPQHPPLLKELSGLSLRLAGVRWPRDAETERFLRGDFPKGAQPEWDIGNRIIAANGPDRVLFWARLPLMVVACMLGIIIYLWGRQLFGDAAALCALAIYSLNPLILGHSFFVTMDVGMAAFSTLFLYTLWNYMRAPSRKRIVWCGLALGAALGAKFSAVLLIPIAAVLLAAARARKPTYVVANRNDKCPCGSGKKYKACHGAQASRLDLRAPALAWLGMCAIAFVVVQALYFFPFDPLVYYRGMALVNADHNPNYKAYLAGEFQSRFMSYFAAAYLLKEPIASIILTAIGLAALRARSASAKWFLLLPPGVIFIVHTLMADNLGLRYIMGVFPFAFLLGGLGMVTLFRKSRAGAAALAVWLIIAAIGVRPDHLSYFNESACLLEQPGNVGIDGGTRCGPLWLDDSNVDWGQGWKQLKSWLDRKAPGRTIRVASPFRFPLETYGISYVTAQNDELALKPVQGLYAVSAHMVARMPKLPGADDWLRTKPPLAIVGHSIYLYDVK